MKTISNILAVLLAATGMLSAQNRERPEVGFVRIVNAVSPGTGKATFIVNGRNLYADGYALGSPTRFGNPAAQLKQFIDTAGPLWAKGELANKVATSFTSAQNTHGGQESTILALNNVFYHWGAVIVPPGYTDPLLYASGGNPYGTNFVAGQGNDMSDETLAAARYQGKRLAEYAAKIRA